MKTTFKEFTIEIIDDADYTLNSSDNLVSYDIEYFDAKPYMDRVYPTSKHGIRVSRGNEELKSAIICEIGVYTTIHNSSFVIADGTILLCCCDKVYSLSIPDLTLLWKKRLDPGTCFAILPFQNDFIIHGELEVKRIDERGDEKWTFSARNIWVSPDGKESIRILENHILLKDFDGFEYELDENGKVVTMKHPSWR